ncbi:hypothetical protein K432DRAFT_119898 [Lepidopterella palustris CBS 459.81]|uniref:Secreted protein n=1 Tax=Lepidopterella palustris CBS 459.81 TaxID=1314670 RepID=A0A8E2E4Z6_9PEZI|nr:hypothetical protein K432DRAFT_119898 [Lepidopterella palustris CBS 459.81]
MQIRLRLVCCPPLLFFGQVLLSLSETSIIKKLKPLPVHSCRGSNETTYNDNQGHSKPCNKLRQSSRSRHSTKSNRN